MCTHLLSRCAREYHTQNYQSLLQKSLAKESYIPQMRPILLRSLHALSRCASEYRTFVGSLKLPVSFAKEPFKRNLHSAKETYHFQEPTNRSHPISLKIRFLECGCGIPPDSPSRVCIDTRVCLYRGIWVSQFGRFRKCGIFSGICHISNVSYASL